MEEVACLDSMLQKTTLLPQRVGLMVDRSGQMRRPKLSEAGRTDQQVHLGPDQTRILLTLTNLSQV
jgi:hypothetical protein